MPSVLRTCMAAAALIVACGQCSASPSHSSTTSSSDPSPPTAAKVLEPWHPPHGGAKCVTDWNCSLGGSCLDGKCVCDPWFTGLNCTYLNLQRAKPDAGLQVDGFHSWGGHASLDKASGKWFGYFSFMVRHCNLNSWTTNSGSVLATATEVDGPYTLYGHDDPSTLAPGSPALIVPPWSHNTYLVQDPPSGEWLLWHIGSGQTPPAQWKNCTSNDDSNENTVPPHRYALESGSWAGSGHTATATADPLIGDTFYVATAPTLKGPWNTTNTSFVSVNQPPNAGSKFWAIHKSNPAPFIFPNGTALVYFSSQNCPLGWPGALAPACIGVAVAPSWRGPYTAVGTTPVTAPESEDPSVFRDPRGNFHMLTNINNCHKHCPAGVACGGHAHSRDGLHWSDLHVGSFGPVITFTNGTTYNAAYVERPQVTQDTDGTPLAFFVGTGIGSYSNSVSWAQKFCTKELLAGGLCGPTAAAPGSPPP